MKKTHLWMMISEVSLIIFLMIVNPVYAEERVRYESADSSIFIKGTSNMHAWTVEGNIIQGVFEIEKSFLKTSQSDEVASLKSGNPPPFLKIEIPVVSIKSDKKSMDKNMYAALKQEKYPSIFYHLGSASLQNPIPKNKNQFELQTQGELTIAGETHPIDMKVYVEKISDNQLKFSGVTSLNMTSFGIQPPRAMFGMMKVGDAVEVTFQWMVSLSPSPQGEI